MNKERIGIILSNWSLEICFIPGMIFGKMIDLPNRFPMYCIDLKQMLDNKESIQPNIVNISNPEKSSKLLKDHPNYPAPMNEHNTLDDARWNRQLYNFINYI